MQRNRCLIYASLCSRVELFMSGGMLITLFDFSRYKDSTNIANIACCLLKTIVRVEQIFAQLSPLIFVL